MELHSIEALCDASQGTSIPEAEARRIFQQMVVAISYCHRLGIANRDIKVTTHLQSLHRPLECMPSAYRRQQPDVTALALAVFGVAEWVEEMRGFNHVGRAVDLDLILIGDSMRCSRPHHVIRTLIAIPMQSGRQSCAL